MADVLGDPHDVTVDPEGVRSGSFDLIIDFERPPSANKAKSHANRWAVVGDTANWRRYGADMILMARSLGHPRRVDRMGITYRQLARDGRWHLDVGNAYPAAKALIDGFVDQGFCPDDINRHLIWLTSQPCHVGGVDGLQAIVYWEIDP